MSSSSGFEQVGAEGELNRHVRSDMPIDKRGYLYVYVSNETPIVDVFFDNLQVTHIRGAILEESHYYPFGLTMAGISSKIAGGMENKKKFNDGTELNTTFDINIYETNFRSLDPQIGRFHQIDPMADITYETSPFVYGNNNPLTFNDPLGLFNDTTGKNPTPHPELEVTVSAKAQVPKQFLPYISFANGRPYSVASFKDWPLNIHPKQRENDLLDSWALGYGAENRVYVPSHPMTKRLKNADQVKRAKILFYKKYYSDYRKGLSLKGANIHSPSNFGLGGLLSAGFDLVEQFVGGFDLDIQVDEKGENLLFIAHNTTGKTSAYYHLASDIERIPGRLTPQGNLNQIYIWSEPINNSFFFNAQMADAMQGIIENHLIK